MGQHNLQNNYSNMSLTQLIANFKHQILSSEINSSLSGHKIPCLLWTWRFLTTFARASHRFLSWDDKIRKHHHTLFLQIHFYISCQKSMQVWGPEQIFLNMPQAGKLLFVRCSQFLCIYPPYVEAISSICSLMLCHTIVTRNLLKWTVAF